MKSAARILQILEHFQDAARPLRAIEIGAALGLPQSSTLGLLKTLVETGYLTFNGRTKTYLPSFRVVQIGRRLSSIYFGKLEIIDLMNDLRARTGECVALTVQNDCCMQCVAMSPVPGVTTAFQEGLKIPIIDSAAGGALMATMRDAEIADLVRRATRRKHARDAEATFASVFERVRAFRAQGYAVGHRLNSRPMQTVAIALPVQPGNVPMVLGVGVPSAGPHASEPKIAALMRAVMAEYLAL